MRERTMEETVTVTLTSAENVAFAQIILGCLEAGVYAGASSGVLATMRWLCRKFKEGTARDNTATVHLTGEELHQASLACRMYALVDDSERRAPTGSGLSHSADFKGLVGKINQAAAAVGRPETGYVRGEDDE
jgi:hypothetical protein